MTNIYESPDQGKTVYMRKAGEPHRTLVKQSSLDQTHNQQLWYKIHRDSHHDPALQQLIEQVEIYYQIKYEDTPCE